MFYFPQQTAVWALQNWLREKVSWDCQCDCWTYTFDQGMFTCDCPHNGALSFHHFHVCTVRIRVSEAECGGPHPRLPCPVWTGEWQALKYRRGAASAGMVPVSPEPQSAPGLARQLPPRARIECRFCNCVPDRHSFIQMCFSSNEFMSIGNGQQEHRGCAVLNRKDVALTKRLDLRGKKWD